MTSLWIHKRTGRRHVALMEYREEGLFDDLKSGHKESAMPMIITVETVAFDVNSTVPGHAWMGPRSDFLKEFERFG